MKVLKFIVSVLLVPVALACAYTALEILFTFGAYTKTHTLPFWLGVVCYVLFQFIFARPMRTYVFGHELTHALAGLTSGAMLKKFKVSQKGGSVTLDRNNIWITLSPYFIPLYSVIVMLGYLFLGFFTSPAPYYPYFIFLIGFTTAFHFALTYYAIKIGQEDLKIYGRFFSIVIIVIINAVTLTLVLAVFFHEHAKIADLIHITFSRTIHMYQYILGGLKTIWVSFQKTS